EQPIIIVAESRIYFIFCQVGLAAELRTRVRHFHRRAVFIFAFVGNQVCLGLPFPAARKESFDVKGVADFLDLAEGVESISLEHLLENWRALLRLRGCRENQYGHRECEKTAHVETTR